MVVRGRKNKVSAKAKNICTKFFKEIKKRRLAQALTITSVEMEPTQSSAQRTFFSILPSISATKRNSFLAIKYYLNRCIQSLVHTALRSWKQFDLIDHLEPRKI